MWPRSPTTPSDSAPTDEHGALPASSTSELEALLNAFGVVVLPDGAGGFVHNAAIYRVDADGRLTRVYDPLAADRTIADLAR